MARRLTRFGDLGSFCRSFDRTGIIQKESSHAPPLPSADSESRSSGPSSRSGRLPWARLRSWGLGFEDPGPVEAGGPQSESRVLARRDAGSGRMSRTSPHDDREGRGPGTKGIDAAADYIAAFFKEAGLKPAPGADGYFQYFRSAATASGDGRSSPSRSRRHRTSRAGSRPTFLRWPSAAADARPRCPSSSPATGSPPRTTPARSITTTTRASTSRTRRSSSSAASPRQTRRTASSKGKENTNYAHVPPQGDQRLAARRGGRPPGQRPAGPEDDEGQAAEVPARPGPSRTPTSRSS